MPTGYTAEIADGKDVKFEDFVLTCARAFGACIMQRDDDMWDKPKLVESSDYHEKTLKTAKHDLAKFKKLGKKQLKRKFELEKETSLKHYKEEQDKRTKTALSYKKMIECVDKWCPPTADHYGLKKFMLDQLYESLKFDCGGNYYQDSIDRLNKRSFDEWFSGEIERLEDSIKYHTEKHEEEVKRTDGRNEWIKRLYESLGLEIL